MASWQNSLFNLMEQQEKSKPHPEPKKSRWRFPLNDNGEIKGINDAGVHTFTTNSFRSLVRESIQNSLDAFVDSERPVEVEFELSKIPRYTFPQADDFARVLDSCKAISQKSEDAKSFFENATKAFGRDEIVVLRISDYGTIGLTGADTCEMGTHWSRLVKESGSSNKGSKSGGSFGIGKYATFACSDFRTVFFSSVDENDYESHIGVARLVSFKDGARGDAFTSGVGYFSDSDLNIAAKGQLSLPCAKRRERGQSGTDVYIMGFKEYDDFLDAFLSNILKDFLVSLWKGKLVARIKVGDINLVLNKNTLAQYIVAVPENDDDQELVETVQHFKLLDNIGTSGVHDVSFDPEGVIGAKKYGWQKDECRLIFMEGNDLNRNVLITRAAGMRLFNKGHISGSIYFTGILLIEGEAMNRDFREMEAPSHDCWSAELAQDSKTAQNKINALNKWIKHTIVEALSKPIVDTIDAYGMSALLPQRRSRGESSAKGESLDKDPVKIEVKKTTPKKVDPTATEPAMITPDSSGDAMRKGKGKGKGGGRNAGVAPGDQEGFVFLPVKQRLMSAGTKGSYRVKIEVPKTSGKARLRFNIKGEKDSVPAVLRGAKVVSGSAQIASFDGDAIALEGMQEGESVLLEFSPDFDQYCQMEVSYYAAE